MSDRTMIRFPSILRHRSQSVQGIADFLVIPSPAALLAVVLTALLASGCWTDIGLDADSPNSPSTGSDEPLASGKPAMNDSPAPDPPLSKSVEKTDETLGEEQPEALAETDPGGGAPDNDATGGDWLAAAMERNPEVAEAFADRPDPTPSPDRYKPEPTETSDLPPEPTKEPVAAQPPADEPKEEKILFPWEIEEEEEEVAPATETIAEAPAAEGEPGDAAPALTPTEEDLWGDAAEESPMEAVPEEEMPVEAVAAKPELPPQDDLAPPVAVNPENTRRLAWLLGSEISFAMLDPRADTTTVEEELASIARVLDLELPDRASVAGEGESQRIRRWLRVGRELSEQLAQAQDNEHAALMEVAFKSNLLLGIFPTKPHLTGAVKESIAAAAARTDLPEELWRPWLDEIDSERSIAQIEQAVVDLHARVDVYLQQQDAPADDSMPSLLR